MAGGKFRAGPAEFTRETTRKAGPQSKKACEFNRGIWHGSCI
jgi:hypothetical protein